MSDVAPETTPESHCSGWSGHTWTLSVDEGTVTLVAEACGPSCAPSTYGVGDIQDMLTMTAIPVRVSLATECPAYDVDDDNVPTGPPKPTRGYESGSHYIAHGSRCDCNWWPVITPLALDEIDRLRAQIERLITVHNEEFLASAARFSALIEERDGLLAELGRAKTP